MSTARVVADSISVDGHRLTTFEVRFHRFVLAEFNTHRVFSRNSASSRAIPVSKQLERVLMDPADPEVWAAEQAGMQGGDELEGDALVAVQRAWKHARTDAVYHAQKLHDLGLHKSLTNRVIEPYMWHTVVITASSYQNFFGLRCSPLAQPEIRVAAEAMEFLFRGSTPTLVKQGEWHTPYILDDESEMPTLTKVQVSSARVARTSHLTQNGVRDFEQDVQLYDRLTSAWPMHASPLEHVATPASWNMHEVVVPSMASEIMESREVSMVVTPLLELTLPMYGNFIGWHQHRFDVEIAKQYQAFS